MRALDILSRNGGWLMKEQGRIIYNQLKQHEPRIYNPALVRRVLTSDDRRKLLRLAIARAEAPGGGHDCARPR